MAPMSAVADELNAFTDSPLLGGGPLQRCAQVFAWLFMHPTAWRNYIKRIDPLLDSDLALAEISAENWRQSTLRELLGVTSIAWPAMAAMLAVIMSLAGVSPRSIVFGICVGLAFGIFFALFVGLSAGFANGLAGGITSALVLSIGGAGAYEGFARATAGVTFEHPFYAFMTQGFGVSLGLAGCTATGIAASTALSVSPREVPAFAITSAEQTGTQADESRALRIARGAIVLVFTVACGGGALYAATTAADSGVPLGLVYGVVFGLVYSSITSLVFGLAVWLRVRSMIRAIRTAAVCIIGGFTCGIFGGLAYDPIGGLLTSGPAYYVAIGMATGTATASLFVLAYVLARRRIGRWAGVLAGAFAGCAVYPALVAAGYPLDFSFALTVAPATTVLSLTFGWWRPVLMYPVVTLSNFLLYIADIGRTSARASLLRWNSAFWDEQQRLPLLILSDHLCFVALRSPVEAARALEYLSRTRQHRAVRDAQIGLDADELERCTDLGAVARHRLGPRELLGGVSEILREFSGISRDVAIVISHPSMHYRRLQLERIAQDLDNLIGALNLSANNSTARFVPAATAWKSLVMNEANVLDRQLAERHEIINPYVVGVPLTEAEEVFSGRTELSQRIAAHLARPHASAIVIYGQRRIGKTSLLRNLPRLLTRSVLPIMIDLQGAAVRAANDASFVYNLVRGMADSFEHLGGVYNTLFELPTPSREDFAGDPFTRFDEWLDVVERQLSPQSAPRTVLLALDEFESLDAAFDDGRLNAELILGTLRSIIQYRQNIRLLLAGSHSLDEFERWAAELVNVEVLRVGYLTDIEARRLIERPTHDFGLEYEPEATERVLSLTRGHPCLVQLLCSEIVELKNRQRPDVRTRVRPNDVEDAIAPALDVGRMMFADIERDQANRGAAVVLRTLASHGEGAIVGMASLRPCCNSMGELDNALNLLERRDLIEAVDGGYRVEVEMIRRWFV